MTVTATAPCPPLPESSPPALGEREWLLACLCARPVTDLLQGQGWDVVTDLDCNVHCSSPDRRVHVGFLPESREATRGELWHIHITDRNGTVVWRQAFGPETPAQAVAGFLAALIASPTRHCTCV